MGGVTLSDKEKLEKENEQFSSAILYVATAVYVGVCAMVFGALYAKLPSFGEAFLTLMKDYGTILAGIPVLVAVVVAKQQLDANRRQHVATVKRSFKAQLDAIEEMRSFIRRIRTFPRSNFVSVLSRYDLKDLHLFTMPPHVVNHITPLISNNAIAAVNQINNLLYSIDPNSSQTDQDKAYIEVKSYLDILESLVEREYFDLSQYWS